MNKEFKKYFSGYLANINEIDSKYNYCGKNFHIGFEDTFNSKKNNGTKEVIIYSKNDRDASEVSKLIHAGYTLLHANIGFVGNDSPEPVTDEFYNQSQQSSDEHKNYYIFSTSGLAIASKIACKVSHKNKFKFALIKYYLACTLHSNDIVDIDPMHSEYVHLKNYSVFDNIRIGYAVVVFYSVIEELGLEIRSNNNKQSLIDGQWNPEVKDDLEKRLLASKINIHEQIFWNFRGTPTKIERRKKPIKKIKTEWSRYDVRDVYIEISDGIRILSWIRSKIASHKLSDDIKSLSVYDVANANFLCRKILLESLRM